NETDYSVNLLAAVFCVAGADADRAELAFYSGMANHFCWIENDWRGSRGCECFGCINETPFEEELRLLITMGLSAAYFIFGGAAQNANAEQIKLEIMESIDKGYPVLSRISTQRHKQSIIIGYENDGEKIVCKAAIEGSPSEGGAHKSAETFVHESWQDTILDCIVLKERFETVPERERVLEQLKLICGRARKTDKFRGKISSGFAAWESYLHMLEHEDLSALPLTEAAPGGDSVQLRLGIYCDGLCQIWERHAAHPFYRLLADKFPEWRGELTAAASALDECSKYGGFLWTQGFAFEGEGLEKFRSPAARKILADEGRRAMQKDLEAVVMFEKILEKEGWLKNY
ncbi:MAG: hypothetical protein FWE82_08350, partial [Defluviitaleaceae bacterium]|nr:hypothetical protein [Defluviitaleaceae bacterium]